jgi:hypothetical protein
VAQWIARCVLAAAALVVVIPLVGWTLTGGPLHAIHDAAVAARHSHPTAGSPAVTRRDLPAPRPAVPAIAAWHRARLPLAGVAVAAAGLIAIRMRARGRRRLSRYWVLPSRVDEAPRTPSRRS